MHKPPSPLDIDPRRRRLLLAGAGLCGLGLSGCAPRRPAERPRLAQNPFTLGVASGDADAQGFVIWTRLAPEPLADGGGLPDAAIEVDWEVAEDERFRRRVRAGTAVAESAWAHSLHVEVDGLAPDRRYWYRFRAGGHESAAGRSRTLPAQGRSPLRFAFASCQHYEQGFYAAYRQLAADAPELVVHLGDYIYESGSSEAVRRHESHETCRTLAQYRARYACYRRDADLQAAHAAAPWFVVWDDHEVENDYAGPISAYQDDAAAFALQRRAAYQAYWEHMPLRPAARPREDGSVALYRQARWGELAWLQFLDTRQYRSDQPCATQQQRGGRVLGDCPQRLAEDRTMLGPDQERWLIRQLADSRARWNVIAQQLLMAPLDQVPGPEQGWWSDGWEGYAAARERLLRQLAERRVANPVVIGGDIHSFWANDIPLDGAGIVASEFVGSSIASRGVPQDLFSAMLPDNPHVRFFDGRWRGYVRCEVGPDVWRTDFVAVDDVRDPQSATHVLARFAVEAGRPGVQTA